MNPTKSPKALQAKVIDKVRMYDEEIMTNDDNLDSNLLASSLLKTSGLHAGTS